MVARDKRGAKLSLLGGATAGLAGGLAILIWLLYVAWAGGGSWWGVFKTPGAPLLGERALDPGFDMGAVVVGLLSHFLVSMGWGVVFGLFALGLSKKKTIISGAVFGIVVWLVMYYIVLPFFGLSDLSQSVSVPSALLQHLLFGLVVAIAFLPYQRQVVRPAPQIPFEQPR